jgi:uncharacterized protein (UPF0147 family)
MATKQKSHLVTGLAAFRANAKTLMALQGIDNDSQLWRLVSRRVTDAPSRKTVNNALQVRHDAQISTLEALAEAMNAPLWVMFIPGLTDTDLQSPSKERLVALVQNYLRCDNEGRGHAEHMAEAFAAKAKAR